MTTQKPVRPHTSFLSHSLENAKALANKWSKEDKRYYTIYPVQGFFGSIEYKITNLLDPIIREQYKINSSQYDEDLLAHLGYPITSESGAA